MKAIAIRIKAGEIVQINSVNVPWLAYLYVIGDRLILKFIITDNRIKNTPIDIRTK